MSASPISPIVPARIGTLLVPVGNIDKSKFDSFVQRLSPEDVIRLGDISPDVGSDRNLFSPLAFPNGVMLYNFMTARPNDVHSGFAPYELFREALVVVGLMDGSTLNLDNEDMLQPTEDANRATPQQFFDSIEKAMIELRQEYSEAFLVQPLVFDFTATDQKKPPYNIITLPTPANSKSTTVRTAMCDLSAHVLAEMTALARSITSADFISSPMVAKNSSPLRDLRNSTRENLHGDKPPLRHSQDGFDNSRARSTVQNTLSAEERERRRASSPVNFQSPHRPDRSVSPNPFARANTGLNSGSALDHRDRSENRGMDRPPTSGTTRETSRDRRGVQSLIVSATERANNRLKSRQGLVIGNLYLLAGRWSDALRELVDNATRAKVFGDHIWYAKGLENILTTMILLAWARIEFTIPPICYSNPEKYASTNRQGRSASFTRSSISTDMTSDESNRSLTNLSVAAPDLIHTIIETMQRARVAGEDTVPQYAFSECVIRLTHLLAILHRSDTTLTGKYLSYLVRGTRIPTATAGMKMRLTQGTSRDIATLVFEAFPSDLMASSMPLEEIVSILSGMVSVLSLAGLYRKRAMIIREALSILIPRLIQARKVGAAEMGIHPAASLAVRHGLTIEGASGSEGFGPAGMEEGFHNLLVLLCNTFGVLGEHDMYKSLDINSRDSKHESRSLPKYTDSGADAFLTQDNDRRHFGGQGLKLDVLRLSANFSEALPNFSDTLHFIAALLKTTGPGSAPQSDRLDHYMFLAPEEQSRFASKIHRTLGSFTVGDAARLETRYWDRFIVRDLELLLEQGNTTLLPLPRSRLSGGSDDPTTPKASGPLIFDPNKRDSKATPLNVFVSGESVDFLVTLQNLYDFEVSVERLELVTEGVSFQPTLHSLVLGPRRRQQILASGVAHGAGELFVTGCRVKVQGCREEVFPIYRQSWAPTGDIKIKESGLQALNSSLRRPASMLAPVVGASDTPQPVRCSFRVVPVQPLLTVKLAALNLSSLDIFVGETRTFQVTVVNESDATKVDFLRLSFVHAFSGSNRKAASQDQIEDSRALTRLEPMRRRGGDDEMATIEPRGSVTFDVEVLGVEGMRESTVQIDYAHVNEADIEDDQKTLYCRRSSLTLQVSVNPAVRLDRLTSIIEEHDLDTAESLLAGQRRVLMMDLTNPWSSPMSVTVTSKHDGASSDHCATIAPQHSARVFVPSPDLESLAQTTDPGLPTTKTNMDLSLQHALKADERARLLEDHLSIAYHDADTARAGIVDLASAYNTLRALALSPLSVDILISPFSADPSSGGAPARLTRRPGFTFEVAVATGLTVTARLRNRSARPLRPFVRFRLGSGRPGAAAGQHDLSRDVAYTGLLHRPAGLIAPGASVDVALGLSVLVAGRFDVSVSAEEIKTPAFPLGWEAEVANAAVLGSARCAVVAV